MDIYLFVCCSVTSVGDEPISMKFGTQLGKICPGDGQRPIPRTYFTFHPDKISSFRGTNNLQL